jgi:hypothetical protein
VTDESNFVYITAPVLRPVHGLGKGGGVAMAARRRLALLAGVVAAGALFSVAACGGGDDEGGAPAEGVTAAGNLDFVVWSYSIETIQDNIKRFEQANPAITIKLADHSWFDYHDIMATKFTGGNAPTSPTRRTTGCRSGWRPGGSSRSTSAVRGWRSTGTSGRPTPRRG